MDKKKDRERKAAQREACRMEGICIGCLVEDAVEDKSYCPDCEEKKNERLAMLVERRKTGCPRCGKKPVKDRKYCAKHLKYQRDRKREAYAFKTKGIKL